MDYPTQFAAWAASPEGRTDAVLSAETREIDPRPGKRGICPRTVGRIRKGETSDFHGISLLKAVTGLPFESFLQLEFLEFLNPELFESFMEQIQLQQEAAEREKARQRESDGPSGSYEQ